ncbi:hypothetical protein PENTCL1PPCAC_29735 [Pristionchus entomophagus]|uniref:Uncharacterized protein n=1 Tax=Pristionchus entomophagus TaxID=358040 RepID=A0AAV5UKJ8_9BILA|nr:hypothetical protein PENTCL1PPCAC_29735 [Pristionchus entomophagus]
MGVILQQLIDVDEKNQVADLNAYLRMEWMDYSVRWDPEEYEGISDLRFRKEQLWTPDVLLYNSADPQYDRSYASNLVVYSNGLVNWMPPGVFRLTCQINIVYFPFDVQKCWMKFGSWTFDGTKLDLQIDDNGFDISSFIPNGEWRLENTSVTRNIQFYECCPEPYYDLVFTFTIRRLALYYAFNLIVPCVLITLLTLVGFTLPPDAGEKMSLQITIMLSICVFQNQIAEMSPPTSEAVPFLGLFFAMCMFTCAGSVVGTALVLNFHNRNRRTHTMGATMKLIMMNWLPWILLMKRPGCIATKRQLLRQKKQVKERLDICLAALLEDVPAPDEEDTILTMDVETIKTTPAMLAQLLVLQSIYKELNTMNQKVEKAEIEKASEDDWKFCAMVLDRLCLFLLTFFITVTSLVLFGIVPDIAASF